MALHLAIISYTKATGYRGTKLITSALGQEAVVKLADEWVSGLPENLQPGAKVSYGGSTHRVEEQRG